MSPSFLSNLTSVGSTLTQSLLHGSSSAALRVARTPAGPLPRAPQHLSDSKKLEPHKSLIRSPTSRLISRARTRMSSSILVVSHRKCASLFLPRLMSRLCSSRTRAIRNTMRSDVHATNCSACHRAVLRAFPLRKWSPSGGTKHSVTVCGRGTGCIMSQVRR